MADDDGVHLHTHDEEGKHSLDTGLPYQDAIATLENAVPGHMTKGLAFNTLVYRAAKLDRLVTCIVQEKVPGAHHRLRLVLGTYAGSEMPRPTDLEADMTFDWMVFAFSSAETAFLAQTAAWRGKMRVGFEDLLWNADGYLARDNVARVTCVRAVLDEIAAVDAAGQTLSPCDR